MFKSRYYASSLVLATEHTKDVDSKKILTEQFCLDSSLIISIDLAILGQEWSIYNWYRNAVREEYRVYDDKDYYQGRKKVLSMLLEKANSNQLFNHSMFQHYNEQAIFNLKKELAIISLIK